MKIIATDGDGKYVVQTGKGLGRILDAKNSKLYPENKLVSIAAHGFWTTLKKPLDYTPSSKIDVRD